MEILLNQPYSFIQLGRRANQEDARFPDEDMPQDCPVAFAVCDGVGGQDRGEVASRTVAAAIGEYMKAFQPGKPFDTSDFEKLMAHVYSRLNKAAAGATTNMGTTMTFVCFHEGGAFCAHIGDSRIYHVRPGTGILYRSEDHSLVNALVHSGNITPEEAIGHPQSNVITRCVSPRQSTSASTIQIHDIEPGDYFFLCTDGVLHQLDDSQLYEILCYPATDADKISTIAGISSGSSDNNTACLIAIYDVVHELDETAATSPEIAEVEVPETTATRPVDADRDMVRDVPVPPAGSDKGFMNLIKNIFR